MTKGLRESLFKNLFSYGLTAVLFLSAVSPRASSENLEKKVMYRGEEYNLSIDTKKKDYSLQPDMQEQEAKEMLASLLLDELVYKIGEERKKLEEKAEEFFWKNPGEMQLKSPEPVEPIASLSQNLSEFNPYPVPETKVNVWKRGRELCINFGLESPDYSIEWYKYNSIGIFYPKGTRIMRRADEAFVLSEKRSEFGMQLSEKDVEADEREAYGKLADLVIRSLLEGPENPIGIIASGMRQVDNFLAKKAKRSREEITEYLKEKYDYLTYSPEYFFAVPEQGRLIRLIFDGRPDSFAIFINSDVKLNKAERGSSTKKSGVLEKIIEISMSKEQVTDETPAGKILKRSEFIGKKIEEFIEEYEYKKQLKGFSFKEKESLYERLNLWNAQISPLCELISKISETEIRTISDLSEYEQFQNESQRLTERIESLRNIVNKYRFVSKYSRNEGEKILELIQREKTAVRENNLNLYLSCFSSDAIKTNKKLIEKVFESRQEMPKGKQEEWQIEKIFVKKNYAIVSMRYVTEDGRGNVVNIRYSTELVKENDEWKNRGISNIFSVKQQP